ncbi:MAG: thiol:disulfide interchange protein DsbA/DsbL [Candidatus Parabeggiatoa sp. nov. 3]|nr:MAG: thiol:disulfide interchange protein DsbA/DsbL [Gammaproteobacteria bacterium]
MKNTLKKWLILVCLTASGLFLTAAIHAAGNDPHADKYVRIDPPQPTDNPRKVEIVELFWYTCPHCKYFDNYYLKNWLKMQPDYVAFRQMPAVYEKDSRIPLAKAYYVADALGVLEQIHTPLFEAIHDKKRNMNSQEALQKFFLDKAGISKEEFNETYNAFGIQPKITRATEMTGRYGVDSVPTIIVNGKYRLTSDKTDGYIAMMKIIDDLIEIERQAMGL